MDEILSRIEPEDKKLLYDDKIIEQLYQDYVVSENSDDTDYIMLGRELKGKRVLLIGPGKNIKLQFEKVIDYINTLRPVTISINYIPDGITPDYVFLTKTDRYNKMSTALLQGTIKTIATSNIECRNGKFDYQIYRVPLLEPKEEIKDNSFIMLLKVLQKIGVNHIACAGLDGYSDKEDNYAVSGMEYDFVKRAAAHLNNHIRKVITDDFRDMNIDFITYSHYADIDDIDSAMF